MGNWSTRFVRPGTQRIEDEAPPMARRDVGTTHSADIQDRSNRRDSEVLNSLVAEGCVRYSTHNNTTTTGMLYETKTHWIHRDKNKSIHAQWNVPCSVWTKPNPENCKNCSSKCAYDCAQLQYTIQRRTALIISPLTSRQTSFLWSIEGEWV